MATEDQRRADERLSKWVDALMEDRERDSFEREIAEDPSLQEEAEAFAETVEVLRHLPTARAPDGFLEQVQIRIKRRTRGRFFNAIVGSRFPYEATFNIVLIGILLGLYMTSMPSADPEPRPIQLEAATGDEAAPKALRTFGEPRRVEGEAGVYELAIAPADLEPLERELDRHATLTLVGEPQPSGEKLLVRVRAGP